MKLKRFLDSVEIPNSIRARTFLKVPHILKPGTERLDNQFNCNCLKLKG